MPKKAKDSDNVVPLVPSQPLWEMGISELDGHNIEAAGREEVNDMLKKGWLLLHIYTLKYREDDI